MTSLWWLVRKELARFRADRSGAVFTVLSPVVLSVLLSLIVTAALTERPTKLLVIDQAQDTDSAAFISQLQADPALSVEVVEEMRARALLDDGDYAAALVLPQDVAKAWEPAALWGPALPITLIYDPAQELLTRQMKGALTRHWMERFLQNPALRLGAVAVGGDTTRLPVVPVRWVMEASNAQGVFNTHAHCFAGMLCMFLLFMGQEMARHVIAERASGVLARIRLAHVAKWEVLGAVAVSTALVALLISGLVYGVGMAVFDVEVRGPWLGFGLMLVAQAVFVGGFALALGAVARTERQLVSLGTLAILLMSFLGGAWLPTFLMPDWVQTLALAVPLHWATEGLAAMSWRGLGWGEALRWGGGLGGFGAALFALGVWRFRWA